jgi:hypothetical protein
MLLKTKKRPQIFRFTSTLLYPIIYNNTQVLDKPRKLEYYKNQ